MSSAEPTLIFNHQTKDENIRVWQQQQRRWLDFDDGLIQTEIDLNQPEVLPLLLNRAMLAGIMFSQQPKRILLAGTGGGATARYFAHLFPDVRGEAVDKSDAVIAVARDYFDFPDTDNWQLITDDIINYVQDCPYHYDLIVIDIAVNQLTPEWLIERSFLQHCRSLLSMGGHVALNLLVNDGNAFMYAVAEIRGVFEQRTICLSLPNYRNIVVMAFKNEPEFPPFKIQSRLSQLEQVWGLEFGQFYQQMLKENPQNSGVL